MLFVAVPLPCGGGLGLPGALGRIPRRPCEPTTWVGCCSSCMKEGACPIWLICWPAWARLGKLPPAPIMPPGGIGRRFGSREEVAEGMGEDVDVGYIMLAVPYGLA